MTPEQLAHAETAFLEQLQEWQKAAIHAGIEWNDLVVGLSTQESRESIAGLSVLFSGQIFTKASALEQQVMAALEELNSDSTPDDVSL